MAQGTYTPTAVWPLGSTDLHKRTFHIDHVSVYGGFAGGETLLTQRNETAHPTILDGTSAGGTGQNAYHVVFFQETDPNSTFVTKLSGFTIRHGVANDANSGVDDRGGGITILSSSTDAGSGPLLDRLIIECNQALHFGGGIYVAGKTDTYLANITFNFNHVDDGAGGGLHQNHGFNTTFHLQNAIFYGNYCVSGNGGGAFATHNDEIVNATFYGNYCEDPNDGTPHAGAYAGLIDPRTGHGSTPLANSIVWGNHCPSGPCSSNSELSGILANFCDVGDHSEDSNSPPTNIHADPLFRDAANANFRLSYYITGSCTNSPGIEAGNDQLVRPDDTDVNNNSTIESRIPWPRIRGGKRVVDFDGFCDPNNVDLGAHEECEGDIDGDGSVGLSDLTFLLSKFGYSPGTTPCTGECLNADLAGCDATIGLADLTALLSKFGSSCLVVCQVGEGAQQAGGEEGDNNDPLTQWILSATPEEVLQWWYDGMPDP